MKREMHPSCDDVLEAFALEPEAGKATLERYLRKYPEYGDAILDFAIELEREVVVRKEPLTLRERDLIDAAWKKHVETPIKPISDPFALLSGVELARIAALLEVPKQVLTALRDRTIIAASIPKRFAERLAAEIRGEFETLTTFLATPPTFSVARSRKSDTKPKVADRKTFEQVLADAGVAPELQKKLMRDD